MRGVGLFALLLSGWSFLLGPEAAAGTEVATPGKAEGSIHWIRVASIIHPVASEFLREEVLRADRAGARALIVELNTPGGLLQSTREMVEAMLGARTPIVVWVAPDGAQAASAGFILLMAADFAVMAPATNAGAAHPVGGAGETIEGVLGEKIEQDTAGMVRALAERRGRNLEKAELAVKKSLSFTAQEALAAGLIDAVAPDLDGLVRALNGRSFEKPKGQARTLKLEGAVIERFELPLFRRLLAALIHPNIAYLLMTLGFLGLYFEFSHPGSILPGVLGAIFLLLGLYALSVLPINFAGVGLILLALLLFIAEIKVTSYGLLTLGGLVAMILGSLMLFRSPDPALRVSLAWILPSAVVLAGTTLILARLAYRAHRLRPQTGAEGLVGRIAVVRSPLQPVGKVFLEGELWWAESEVPVAVGDQVEVMSVEGLRLRVRPVAVRFPRK
jgi:membrane-bound serine protease (ClpP class)